MNAAVATNHDVVLDRDVAAQHGTVAHDNVVTQHAVMRDMTGREEDVVGSNPGAVAVVGGAVDRDVFAEDVAVANAEAGIAAGELEILGFSTDTGVRKHLAGLAQLRVAFDGRVVVQARAVAQSDTRADVSVRTDFDVGAEVRTGFNNGRGVDLCGHELSPFRSC